jgi:hypothetical protein
MPVLAQDCPITACKRCSCRNWSGPLPYSSGHYSQTKGTYRVTILDSQYIHTYILTYLHTYILTFLHTYILTYLHTYILTYLHTYIHTYIHTHIYILFTIIYYYYYHIIIIIVILWLISLLSLLLLLLFITYYDYYAYDDFYILIPRYAVCFPSNQNFMVSTPLRMLNPSKKQNIPIVSKYPH